MDLKKYVYQVSAAAFSNDFIQTGLVDRKFIRIPLLENINNNDHSWALDYLKNSIFTIEAM
jgi:hypothetical protein